MFPNRWGDASAYCMELHSTLKTLCEESRKFHSLCFRKRLTRMWRRSSPPWGCLPGGNPGPATVPFRNQMSSERSSFTLYPFSSSSYPIKRPKPFNNIEVSDLLGPAACTQLNSGKKWAFVEKPPFTGKLSLSPEISGNLKKPLFSPGQACGVPQPPLPAIEYFERLRDRYAQIKSSQSWFYIFNK